VDVKPINELRKKYDFHLIEDAACSVGSKIRTKKVGSQADVTCFSFHPRKIITTGEGGMLVTNDKKLAAKAQITKNFGLIRTRNKFIQKKWGTNLKLTDIQAAMGIIQLSKIEKIIKNRIKKAHYYDRLFESIEEIITPTTRSKTRHTYQTYCILIKRKNQRDKLMSNLHKFNIETNIGSFALHLQPAFSNYTKGKLNNSKNAYENGLAMPLHGKLMVKDQNFVVERIKKFLSRKNL